MDYINPNVQCTQNGQTYVKNHAAVMATKTFNVCFTIFWTLGIIGCSKEFFSGPFISSLPEYMGTCQYPLDI